MQQVVPKIVPPATLLLRKYFPDVSLVPGVEHFNLRTSAPIYFGIAFRHDYEERAAVEQVDEAVLGIGRHDWGGEYDDTYSGYSVLGSPQQSNKDECGHKRCELRSRFVCPNMARLKILPITIPLDFKGITTEAAVQKFNEWFENRLDLPLSLTLPTGPRYATLVISRLYFMHGIKHQFISPYGCQCYHDQECTQYHINKIRSGNYNNPLQLDGFAVHYNKGFAIVLPSARYLNSDLLWTVVWKQEQKEFSQNRNVASGWDSIRYDTKLTDENIVRHKFLQALSTLSELNNKVPEVSDELRKSDLFARFHSYNAVNDVEAIFPRAARRLRATKFVWQIVRNILAAKLSGRWEKKSLWLGNLPPDFDEKTIAKYIPESLLKKELRNFQYLPESRTCFLNFHEAKNCSWAMKYLNWHGMRVEFAKKKQFGSKKGKKTGNFKEIGKCFQCGVKGHKEGECYNTGGILPIEIWFNILDYMNLARLGKMSKISKYWNSVVFRYWNTIVPLAYINPRYGITPLHAATWLQNLRLIKFFINTGPESWLNAQDQLGHTPLHYANALQNTTVIKELKSRGCKEYIVDKEGHRPEALMLVAEKVLIRDRIQK